MKNKKLPLGFTFSFPCKQTKLDEVSDFKNHFVSSNISTISDYHYLVNLMLVKTLVMLI